MENGSSDIKPWSQIWCKGCLHRTEAAFGVRTLVHTVQGTLSAVSVSQLCEGKLTTLCLPLSVVLNVLSILVSLLIAVIGYLTSCN